MNIWEYITQIMSFTGVTDITVWQDIVLSSILIPLVLYFLFELKKYFSEHHPLRLLLKGMYFPGEKIFIYLAQLHPVDNTGNEIIDQKYAIDYPNPHPQIPNAISRVYRKNINPLWAEADGKCLSSIYNLLGRIGKIDNIHIGDFIKNWDEWTIPTFSVGFNPKYEKLINKCNPIYFHMGTKGPGELNIKSSKTVLNSFLPNDAAIIQKTHIKDTSVPVFFLAGLGIYGTKAAGFFFQQNALNLGKLYGDKPFCVLLRINVQEGDESAKVVEMCPKPPYLNRIVHPITYFKFREKFIDAK